VVKSAADELAEKNGTFGMIVYPDENGLVQFRVRRNRAYQGFDLRDILTRLSIENGGGPPRGHRLQDTQGTDLRYRFPCRRSDRPDLRHGSRLRGRQLQVAEYRSATWRRQSARLPSPPTGGSPDSEVLVSPGFSKWTTPNRPPPR
jgi:hypothetical protein